MAPADKAERLLDLVILLLSVPRPLTVGEIRARIPGYDQQNEDTFHRMFERDKVDLRDIGLPLEQEESLSGIGYRVRARDALLDDPGLTQDEQAALALAARVWEGGGDASTGMLKLAATSGDAAEGPAGFMLPRVRMGPDTEKVLDAVARRKRITFRYRTAAGEVRDRTVEPAGLALRRGQWYISGRDVDADGDRHFKVTRIDGPIGVAKGSEPDFDPPATAIDGPRAPWEGDASEEARIMFSADTAWSVERRAGVRPIGERDGAIELAVPFSDLPTFASWIAGFGARAVVIEPPALRAAVVERLRAMAGES